MAWTVQGNIRGPQGAQGPAGAAGAAGAPGPLGPAGPAGANYRGIWNNTTAYAEHDVVTRNGASFIVPTGTATIAAGADPNTSGNGSTATNGWALFAAEGAQGPAGATGPAGAQGPQGAAGPSGAAGSTGPQGAQGPAGATGAAGAQGPQGARGTQWYTGSGAPGTIAGSQAGDMYLDTATGDTYQLA